MAREPFRYHPSTAGNPTPEMLAYRPPLFDKHNVGDLLRSASSYDPDEEDPSTDDSVLQLLQILSDETCELKRQLDELRRALQYGPH